MTVKRPATRSALLQAPLNEWYKPTILSVNKLLKGFYGDAVGSVIFI